MTLSTLGVAFLFVAGTQGAERVPVSDLQNEVLRVIDAQSETEWYNALEALRASVGDERDVLVQQLFHLLRQSTSTREGMAFAVIRRALPVSDEEVLSGLLPLLEERDDEAQLAAVRSVLTEFENLPNGDTDFAAYIPFLRTEPPLGLVQHMLTTDPDAALRTFVRRSLKLPPRRHRKPTAVLHAGRQR